MGFYFRKSVKAGPFRINFSKSGIGVSAGVKGARVSMGPKGTYVNLGAGGIYYRKKINLSSNYKNPSSYPVYNPPVYSDSGKHTITSTNFENLTDSDSQEFISDLENISKKISYFKWFGWIPSLIILFLTIGWTNEVIKTDNRYGRFFEANKDGINIRAKPSKNGKPIFYANSGDSFLILDTTNAKWTKIQLQNDTLQEAFISKSLGFNSTKIAKIIETKRFSGNPEMRGLIILSVLAGLVIWCIYLYRKDQKRLALELFYEMDDQIDELYKKFLGYFTEFSHSNKIWQYLHSERIYDTKYSGGATASVRRIPVISISNNSLPVKFLKTNVSIPHISLKNTDFYFLPERLVLKRGDRFAAVFYKNLEIEANSIRFNEDKGVPNDAEVVGHTWKYINKSGGPDLRFKDNRQIPVCRYSEYHFKSIQGINEIIKTSKYGAMDNFVHFINIVGKYQSTLNYN